MPTRTTGCPGARDRRRAGHALLVVAVVALGRFASQGAWAAPAGPIAQPMPEPAVGATRPGADTYPPLRASFAGGVTGIPGVIYRRIDGYRPLDLDLYVPRREETSARLPLVVFVHGGGWFTASSRDLLPFVDAPSVLASVAARGFVVASVNYRLSGEARYPAALQDVKAAIAFLRDRAGEYSIDPSRVAVWGASAGGQLAMLATLTCGVEALAVRNAAGASSPAGADCVQAGVSWYGVSDLRSMPPAPSPTPHGAYLGCEPPQCPAETLRLASAVSFVSAAAPPMLLIHGGTDRLSPRQSSDLAAALRAAGARAEYVEIPGVAHNFVGTTAEETRRANVDALRRTLEFLERELAPGARGEHR